MNERFNATYTLRGLPQPAQLQLQKNHAAVFLHTEKGTATVYWPYHQTTAVSHNRFALANYPPQSLEILDSDLASAFHGKITGQQKRKKSRQRQIAGRLLVFLLLCFCLAYFLVAPAVASLMVARTRPAFEKQLDDAAYAGIVQAEDIDAARSVNATTFLKALQFPASAAMQVLVLKGDVQNAFALPGGRIILYEGLLQQLKTYPALAALLAHEAIHIQRRHAIKALYRQVAGRLFFTLLFGNGSALQNSVLARADALKNLHYSRVLETEADTAGLRLLQARGIAASGFTDLFYTLQRAPGAEPPEWASSHPALATRMARLQKIPPYKMISQQTDGVLDSLFKALQAY